MRGIPNPSRVPADRKVAGAVDVARVLEPEDLSDLMADLPAWQHATGDSDGPPAITSQVLEMAYFLAGRIHGDMIGAGFFVQRSMVAYDAHIVVRRQFQGSGYTFPLAAQAVGWMFSNTSCRKLVSHVAVDNHPALALISRLGFVREGTLARSFSRAGILLDEAVFGMTDEEYRSWAAG
jgi:GNAT superfamily N-acetyltransferase